MADATTVKQRYEVLRKKLIDTSMRNRMLNFRMPRTHGVEITGEDSLLVYDRLVTNEREMSFDGKPDPPSQKALDEFELNTFQDEFSQSQFRDAAIEELEAMSTLPIPPTSQTDSKLNTNYFVSHLAARLLKTYRDARLTLDETGVNMLYLALGALHWKESEVADKERIAPLVFVPVELKQLKNGLFKVAYDSGNVQDNLALAEKLKEQRIDLPRLADGGDIGAYLSEVKGIVGHRKDWHVEEDWIAMSFFQFSKIAMYLDLDEAHWPVGAAPSDDADIGAVLGDGYPEADIGIDETEFIDDHRPVEKTNEVLNCDASQALAILRAQAGNSMVIEGPPGTGKSQTIVNLIAEFVGEGKSVLFVSEKMAALDVVDRQLAKVGLGDIALKLHSKESKRREFYEELKRVLNQNKSMRNVSAQIEQYTSLRDQLNAYCSDVNTPLEPYGITPHEAIGHASCLPEELPEDLPYRIPFEALRGLSWQELQNAKGAIANYQSLLSLSSPLSEHEWYGAGITLLTPGNRVVIQQASENAHRELSCLISSSKELSQEISVPPPTSMVGVEQLLGTCQLILDSPAVDGISFADVRWESPALLQAIEDIELFQSARNRFEAAFATVKASEAEEHTRVLNEWEPKWWRIVSSDFRRAARFVRELEPATTNVFRSAEEIVAVLRARDRVNQYSEEGLGLLKSNWQELESNVQQLKQIASFAKLVRDQVASGAVDQSVLNRFLAPVDKEKLRAKIQNTSSAFSKASESLNAFFTETEFTRQSEALRDIDATLSRLDRCKGSIDSLDAICKANIAEKALVGLGLGTAIETAKTWANAGSRLSDTIYRSYLEGVLTEACKTRESLGAFNSEAHLRRIEEFRKLDDLMFQINSAKVRLKHLQGIPSSSIAIGNLGDLHRQMQLKRGHKPIRWALDTLGEYILRVKPLFMMSPLSVSQFLPRSDMRFDVLIFDEASQVRPEDALAAMARSNQTIVVGDDKQLPPTSFFEKLGGEGIDEDEDEGLQGVQDQESVLGLMSGACQVGRRITDLRYHYRSLHPNLIRVSNTEFYQDRLIVFPSSGAEDARGLVFHHNSSDVYDRGRTRSNRQQAKRVIERVFQHMREEPNRSLGIVAFSEAQQQALLTEFDLRLRSEPELLDAHNARHPFENLFIKNLETVQGDERDVIYISVGYGPDEHGKFTMSFGPINAEGGERRLNVLMTRAKRRCEVFSSFTAADMRTLENPARGPAVLKRFLQFAQTGELDDPRPTDRPPDSPFEEQVAERLQDRGYEVHHQVGSIGYAIDLAIVDPDNPGAYLIGIECDGAGYHSARSARDRDKIRQMALESRGWKLHRIWSTDWWQQPGKTLDRCCEAIEIARAGQVRSTPALEIPSEAVLLDQSPTGAAHNHYKIANISREWITADIYTTPTTELVSMIRHIVEVEGPVHADVVTRRLCAAFLLGRAGSRVQQVVSVAIRHASALGLIEASANFLNLPGRPVTPRDRSRLSNEERRVDWVSDQELEVALIQLAKEARGAGRSEIAGSTWRLLGFSRTTDAMSSRSHALIDTLLRAERLREIDGLLHAAV